MNQRPTAVTVFGILNIVFGIFGILGLLANAVLLSVAKMGSNAIYERMMEPGVAGTWYKISLLFGGVAAIVEVLSGMGLLQMKEWGRKFALGFCAYTIAAAIIGTIIAIAYVVPGEIAEANRTTDPSLRVVAISGAYGAVIGSCGGLIYPLIMLFFLTRPEIIAAFQPMPPAAPNYVPGQPAPPPEPTFVPPTFTPPVPAGPAPAAADGSTVGYNEPPPGSALPVDTGPGELLSNTPSPVEPQPDSQPNDRPV